jgi:peptidyl-prolyl cis-trans isomerase D
MFNFIQKHNRLIQILLALIGLTFATWGIQSYTQFIGPGNDVATVDGIGIGQKEFTDQLRRQQERMRALLGNAYDMDKLDTPKARLALLETMIQEQLIAEQAAKAHLTVSSDLLRSVIASQPAFQKDGKFSRSSYETLLNAQGMTPVMFESRMRSELALGELTGSIQDTAIASHTVAERLAALLAQKREVAEATIASKQFLDRTKPDEALLKAYYEAHLAEFRIPERVQAQYLELSPETLGAQIQISQAELEAAYKSRQSEFRTPEERRASHILIQLAPKATPEQKEAARNKAEQILAELRKSPSSFAELAKKDSQDPGSASRGGDLGFFRRDTMVKPFADAVFGMSKVGQIVGPIETPFGFHIIELTGIHPAAVRPLPEVRAQLTTELRSQQGLQKFNEAAEKFSDMVYEQSDSLEPAAKQFGLPIKTTGWIVRGANPKLGELNNSKLIGALFSADSLKFHRNSDAIEVAQNTLVSARVVEHEAAREPKFDEVKARIEQELKQQAAERLAVQDGEAKLAQLRKGDGAGLQWDAAKEVSRLDPQGMDPEALRQVMSADASKLPAYVGMEQEGTGFVIYRISKVIAAPSGTKPQQSAELLRTQRAAGAEQFDAYLAALRAGAKVKIHEKNLLKQ